MLFDTETIILKGDNQHEGTFKINKFRKKKINTNSSIFFQMINKKKKEIKIQLMAETKQSKSKSVEEDKQSPNITKCTEVH